MATLQGGRDGTAASSLATEPDTNPRFAAFVAVLTFGMLALVVTGLGGVLDYLDDSDAAGGAAGVIDRTGDFLMTLGVASAAILIAFGVLGIVLTSIRGAR